MCVCKCVYICLFWVLWYPNSKLAGPQRENQDHEQSRMKSSLDIKDTFKTEDKKESWAINYCCATQKQLSLMGNWVKNEVYKELHSVRLTPTFKLTEPK